MKIPDLLAHIEKTAPLSIAADWDVSGMQVAALRQDVTHLALCLDPSPASLGKALELGADFILSHHPLLMRPRLPARVDDYHRALSLLLRHNVPLYAAHTSLDANPRGPSGWLARILGLQNPQVLEITALHENAPAGFGQVGDLPAPLSFKALVELLCQHISLEGATLCGMVPASVTKVAYCTGSGASLLPQVSKSGADIYISGDIKYHTALETGICIFDVGHHSLEEEMMRCLSLQLQDQLPSVTVSFVPSVSPLRPLSSLYADCCNQLP